MRSLFTALGVAVFVVFCIVALQSGTGTHPVSRAAPSPSGAESSAVTGGREESPLRPELSVDAVEYANQYHRNEVLADETYKGHRVAVTGLIKEIRKDFMDKTYVEMFARGTVFGGVHAEFNDAAAHGAAALIPNSTVTLVCTGEGMFMEMPFLKDCEIRRQPQGTPDAYPSSSTAAAIQDPQPSESTPDAKPAEELRQSTDLRRHYIDTVYGYQFDYPATYHVSVKTDSPNTVGIVSPDDSVSILAIGSSASDHTVAEAYARERAVIHATPTYEAKGKTWIVLSWREDGKAYYLKRFVGAGAQNTFIISFPEDQMNADSFLPTMVEHSFRPGDLSQVR